MARHDEFRALIVNYQRACDKVHSVSAFKAMRRPAAELASFCVSNAEDIEWALRLYATNGKEERDELPHR